MRLTIPRDKWQRGEDHGASLWDTSRDCGCVLGHLALAVGYSRSELDGVPEPSDVSHDGRWPPWVIRETITQDEWDDRVTIRATSDSAEALIEWNDRAYCDGDGRPCSPRSPRICSKISDDEREAALIRLMAKHGIELEFV